MPKEEYEGLKEKYDGLKSELDPIFLEVRSLQKEVQAKGKKVDRKMFENLAAAQIAPLREKYPQKILQSYFEAMAEALKDFGEGSGKERGWH